MSSYALCTVVLSAEGQVSGTDLRHVSDRCGSRLNSRSAELVARNLSYVSMMPVS